MLTKDKPLLISIIIVVLLKLPSLFDPFFSSDEAIYDAVGLSLRDGANLYTEVFDHKPPLIYFIYQFVPYLNRLFFIRLLGIIWGIVGIIAFSYVLQSLFPFRSRVRNYSLIIFAVIFSSPFIDGHFLNAENLFVPINLLAFAFSLKGGKKGLFLGGLFFGVSVMVKLHPIADIIMLSIWLTSLALYKQKEIKFNWVNLASMAVGFILPLLFIASYLLLQGSLTAAIDLNLGTNLNYVQQESQQLSLVRAFFLFEVRVVLLLLGIIVGFWLFRSNKLNRSNLLVYYLFLGQLFFAFLSGRLYEHYLLQLTPSVSIILACIMDKFKEGRNGYVNYLGTSLTVVCFVTIVLLPFFFRTPLGVNTKYRSFIKSLRYQHDFYQYVLLEGEYEEGWYDLTFGRKTKTIEELKRHFSDIESQEDVFIYSDSAVYYSYFDNVPETFIVVYYHHDYTKGGTQRFLDELMDIRYQYVLVQKDRDMVPGFQNYLANSYEYLEEGEDFEKYVRR